MTCINSCIVLTYVIAVVEDMTQEGVAWRIQR